MAVCVVLITCNAQTLPVNGNQCSLRPSVFLADLLQEWQMGIGLPDSFSVIVGDRLAI
jgi:hypothetical protein